MRRIYLLTVSAVLIAGCTRERMMEGTISDASMNTVTIICEDGTATTFSTSEADTTQANGLITGSPATIYYKGKAAEGRTLRATRIVTPEQYSMLIGMWVIPDPIEAGGVMGFMLEADGKAKSINMATLVLESWRYDEGRLTISGRSIGNGQTIDFDEEYTVESLDDTTLVLARGDEKTAYTRLSGNNE